MIDADNNIIAGDSKVIIDDNALYRHKDYMITDPDKTPLENEPASLNAFIFDSAVPVPFSIIAPACPILFPGGALIPVMYGYIDNDIAYFTKFVTTSAFGKTEINIIDDDPVMEWLKYI